MQLAERYARNEPPGSLRLVYDFATHEAWLECGPQKKPAIYVPETGTFGQVQAPVRPDPRDSAFLAEVMCEVSLRGEIAKRLAQEEISIAEYAEASEVSERQIRRILKGHTKNPTVSTLRSLARGFKKNPCTLADLRCPSGEGRDGDDRSSDHQG